MSIEYVNPPELNDEEAQKAEKLRLRSVRELGRLAACVYDMTTIRARSSLFAEFWRRRNWRSEPLRFDMTRDAADPVNAISDPFVREYLMAIRGTSPEVRLTTYLPLGIDGTPK